MAACFPEQFMKIGAACPPDRTSSSRAASPAGQSAGVRRAESSSPAEASTSRTLTRWCGSPQWDAAAIASRASRPG